MDIKLESLVDSFAKNGLIGVDPFGTSWSVQEIGHREVSKKGDIYRAIQSKTSFGSQGLQALIINGIYDTDVSQVPHPTYV